MRSAKTVRAMIIVAFIIIIAIADPSSAQFPEWIIYDTSNSGLPNDWVTSIAIDKNGNKWIGTSGGGLAKFDGMNWTVYNSSNSGLPDDWINAIAVDAGGNVWLGTQSGLAIFDGANWTVYNTSNSKLPKDWINCLSVDKSGNIWAGSWVGAGDWGGLAKFDGVNWTVYNTSNSGLPDDRIFSIVEEGGNIWIGTQNGLASFDGTNWVVYNSSNSGLPDDWITAIAIDGDGNKWIGTSGNGLAKFDGMNWTVYNTSNSGLPNDWTNPIIIDGGGGIWIGTWMGLAGFDGTGWTVYNTSNSGLPDNRILSLAVEGGGSVWIGTKKGLAKFIITQVRVDPPFQEVVLRDSVTFNISVRIDNIDNIGAFEFGLEFDPSKMEVKDFKPGSFLESTGNTVMLLGPEIDNSSGVASFGAYSAGGNPGPSGSGELASITLRGLRVTESADLDLKDVQVTDAQGNLIPVGVKGGSVKIRFWVDVDGDSDIDIVDIQLVAGKWNSKIGDSRYDPSCDVDNDGDIDIADVQKVASYWRSEEPFAKLLVLSKRLQGRAIIGVSPSELTLSDGTEVEVRVEDVSELGAFEFEINYSPDVISIEGVELGDFLGSTGNTAMSVGPDIDNIGGKVKFGAFSFGGNPAPSGSGVLAILRISPVRAAVTQLNFKDIQITDKSGNVLTVGSTKGAIVTGVSAGNKLIVPEDYVLLQNYPNPFNPGTEIRYGLPEGSWVVLTVYNMLGQEVLRIVDKFQPAGWYSAKFNGGDLPSGVYLYSLRAGKFIQNRKMVLIR